MKLDKNTVNRCTYSEFMSSTKGKYLYFVEGKTRTCLDFKSRNSICGLVRNNPYF